MLLTLVKFNDGGKIYLEISMVIHLGLDLLTKYRWGYIWGTKLASIMWVRPESISLIPDDNNCHAPFWSH